MKIPNRTPRTDTGMGSSPPDPTIVEGLHSPSSTSNPAVADAVVGVENVQFVGCEQDGVVVPWLTVTVCVTVIVGVY